MQIRDDTTLTWPDKLKCDPNNRLRDKNCRFHRDHGHKISECYDLKQQVEDLIKQRKLQRFFRGRENPPRDPKPNQRSKERLRALPGEIRVTVERSSMAGSSRKARKKYLRMVQIVQISG